MSKILKVAKPSDYSSWVGQNDTHEYVSVIDYSEVSPVRSSLNDYGVYGLFLQGDDEALDLTYGAGQYDYKAGTLICVAPGQLGGKEDTGELINLSGWVLLFHPDILQGTSLERDIKKFSFFEYRVNEALHMSEEEREVLIALFRQLKEELSFSPDQNQNQIIVGFINLILRYCQRFYDRQFITRKIDNSGILVRFETLINDYFDSNREVENGLPGMQYCAEQLHMSSNYLGDVIKKTTGQTASNYIKHRAIQIAKNRLVSGMNISEVAYSLGFVYPQHFARLFKKITGITPSAYASVRGR